MEDVTGETMMRGTRRSHLDIIADVLTVAKKLSIQNRIIQQCNLSHAQCKSLTVELIRNGLITTQQVLHPRPLIAYLTTDKGKQFLEKYSMLLPLLESARAQSL